MKNTTPNPLIPAKTGTQAFCLSVQSDGEDADLTTKRTKHTKKKKGRR